MADVLVVGAGPVGLTMAAELARHGVRCRIIDKLAAPSGYCKAIGVTPRTLEVWEDMGVARDMIDAGLWLVGLRTIVAGKSRDAPTNFPELPYGNLGIPQYATERILGEHLSRLGITVERGIALSGIQDDGRRVTAALTCEDGRTESAECRFVIGCDGAHSVVRRGLNIGFPGDRFPMEFMLGDVAIDWDVPRGIAVFSIVPRKDDAPDFLVAIPLPERGRYRVSMLAPPELAAPAAMPEHGISSERTGPSLAQLQTVADRLLPGAPRFADLRWSSLFGISMRLADTYRVGNCFIAGDAAHIHPPTGGQGMNTGIQDAYNLAWKVALVMRGEAGLPLLDSYGVERRPVGADVVERTRKASMSFGRERASKDSRLADTQILVNYRWSAWVKDGQRARMAGVRAGDRAPDANGLRCEQVGFELRLFDVLRGTEHVLIAYLTGREAHRRAGEIEKLAGQLREASNQPLRAIAIAPPRAKVPGLVGLRLLRDEAGQFVRNFDVKSSNVWLVRPDGYIAYTAARLDRRSIVGALARSLAVDGGTGSGRLRTEYQRRKS